jgi:hypothetical protein
MCGQRDEKRRTQDRGLAEALDRANRDEGNPGQPDQKNRDENRDGDHSE